MVCTPSDFIAAMRRFPASVSIIATGAAGNRVGMTVSAVCSLTAEPPQLLVSLNLSNGTTNAIRENGWFSVNVLRADQADLALRFSSSRPELRGEARFEAGDWRGDAVGAPILADAAESFLCKSAGAMETASHLVMIGAVQRISPPATQPVLLYENGTWGRFAEGHSALGGHA